MRWVTYADASGHDRVGVVQDGAIHTLQYGVTLLNLLDSPDGLSAARDRALAAPSEVITLDGATLRAPLQPRSIELATLCRSVIDEFASEGARARGGRRAG